MLTVGLITARKDNRPEWFFDSLQLCGGREVVSQIILVDQYAEACDSWSQEDVERRRGETMIQALKSGVSQLITYTPPKPNVWNGKHRLTPRNWWDAGNARNTALCLCRNNFIAFLDDRCVLATTWIDAIREAMEKQYVVCGMYEKVHNLVVDGGKIVSYTEPKNEHGQPTGKDGRAAVALGRKMICPGTWVYGCTFALPTEWMLNVNGTDESWGSISMEDTHFGQMLENNGYPIYHDPRLSMIEDRTSNDHGMKRDSKEKHSNDKNDKTHKMIEKIWTNKKASHQWNFRELRQHILNGGSFPIPVEPTVDWFDGQPLAEMW